MAACFPTKSSSNKESGYFTTPFWLEISLVLTKLVQTVSLHILGMGWVTYREHGREGSYVVLSFLLVLFCVLCGVIFKRVLKRIFSIISASGFRKKKHKYGSAIRMKFITLQAVVQS